MIMNFKISRKSGRRTILSEKLMNNREAHEVNRRLYNRKGYKSTEDQFAKNQIVQTIESNAYNESGIEAQKEYERD